MRELGVRRMNSPEHCHYDQQRLGNTMMLPPASEHLIRPTKENYAQGQVAVHYCVALCLLDNSIAPCTAAQFYPPLPHQPSCPQPAPWRLGCRTRFREHSVVAASWPQRNRNASRMNGV